MKSGLINTLTKGLYLLCLAGLSSLQQLSAQCAMACFNNEQISLDANCEALITSDRILKSATTCNGPFTVTVIGTDGLPIPSSPLVNSSYIGQTLTVEIRDISSNNFCWGRISIEDKLPPTIACRDTTLACYATTDGLQPIASDACGPVQLTFNDQQIDGSCQDTFTQRINRTWTATDGSGNTAQCQVSITLERLPLDSIRLPDNFDDVDQPALLCENRETTPGNLPSPNIGWNALANGHPSPDAVFYPAPNDNTVQWKGSGRPSGGCDGFSATFTDLRLEECSTAPSDACFKILRRWTLVDHCSDTVRVAEQIIKVLDKEAPIISNLPDLTITTDIHQCEADWIASIPSLSDNCQTESALDYQVIEAGQGQIQRLIDGRYRITNLPIGQHAIVYQAADCCGNSRLDTLQLTVEDAIPPTAVCDQYTQASLISDGTTRVFARSFNDQSHDNCGLVFFKVIRKAALLNTPNGSTQSQNTFCTGLNGDDDNVLAGNQIYFDDYIQLCCEDAEQEREVVLRVFDVEPGDGPITPARMAPGGDLHGRFSDCDAFIEVFDKRPPTIICPANVTLNCVDDFTDLQLTGLPNTVDNCQIDTTFFTDQIDLDNCNVGEVIRQWTTRDVNGLEAICIQRIELIDTTAATILFPPDTTVSCGASMDPSATGNPMAFDDCSQLYISFDDLLFEFPDSCTRKILRTWNVLDWCSGQRFTQLQVIKEFDDVPPMLVVPPDATVDCDAVPNDPIGTGLVTASDNCDNAVDIVLDEERQDGDCLDRYILIRTFTAFDNCGNDTSIQQILTVVDQNAPTFANVASDLTLECDLPIPPVVNPIINDNCDPSPQLDFQESTIQGDCMDKFDLVRIWTATDRCGNSSSTQQVISFQDSSPPIFSDVPMNMTLECSDSIPVSAMPQATDNCDPMPLIEMTEIRLDGSCPQEFVLRRSWTATDRCGNATTIVQRLFFEDNSPPILTGIPPDITIECRDDSNPVVSAIDNCDQDVDISLSEVSNGPCDGNNTRVLTWTATDNCGNSSTASQVITLEDTTPPELTNVPADVTVDCNDIPDRIDPIASDTCTGVSLQFEERQGPGSCPDEALIVRIWTAEDGCGNTTVDSQRIFVVDTLPPMITDVPNDTTVLCNQIPGPPPIGGKNINATDNCDDRPAVAFIEERMDGSCQDEYTLIRFWVAEDACGNRDTVQQQINVIDTIPPDLVGIPADVSAECDNIPDAPNIGQDVTASDNCDNNPSITLSVDTLSGSCAQEFEIQRTWTATDACGNQSSATQRLFISDTTPPQLSNVPDDIQVSCDSIPDFGDADVNASDNCDPMPTISMRSDTLRGSCLNEFTIERIWIAEDACGNKDSLIQRIEVSDQQPPSIEGVPADTSLQCDAILEQPMNIRATDNCLGMPDLRFEADTIAGNCPQEFTINRRWIAEDACGNRDTMTQQISVIDTVAPLLIGLPTDTTVSCEAIPAAPIIGTDLIAADNCDTSANIRLVENSIPDNCANESTIFRTWIAEDACGNRRIGRQTIMVIDTTAPVLEGIPADTMVACEAIPGPPPIGPILRATDNCGGMIDYEFRMDTLAGRCTNEFTLLRTWIAQDACGNRDSATQRISVIDTVPPVLEGIPNDTIVPCDAVPVPPVIGTKITASDACGGPVDIRFFSRTRPGTCANEFTLLRHWVAEDDCGNLDTLIQEIQLRDTVPPLFNGIPADTNVSCSAIPAPPVIGRDITASDNCSRIVPIEFFADTIGGTCTGEFTIIRNWVAEDACDNRDTIRQTINVSDTEPPMLEGIPADTMVSCDAIPSLPVLGSDVQAMDNCDDLVDITLEVDTLRGRCENEFSLLRRWIAEDDCGNRDTATQRVVVSDLIPPVLTGVPADTTVDCDQVPAPPVIGTELVASDNCSDSVSIRLEADTLGGRCLHEFVILRRWIAEDACGNQDTALQRIQTIDRLAPVLTGIPADTAISCTEAPNFAGIPAGIQAVDNCDPNPSIQMFSDTIAGRCATEFTIRRFWVAEDACGNRDTAVQQLSLVDSIGPVLVGIPADTTVACNQLPAPPIIGQDIFGMDSCSDSVDIEFVRDSLPGICANEFTVRRRWIARDACGNVDTFTQNINVIDTVAPELMVPLPQMGRIENGDSCDVFINLMATATDICDSNVQITHNFADAANPFSTNGDASGDYPLGLTSVVFTATDACGNSTQDSSLVEIVDRFGPVFTCGDLSITLDPVTLQDTVFPEQIMTSSVDLCSNPTTRFFINTPDPTMIIFSCDDPASSFVFIETADAVGNTLICGARVNITNKAAVCPVAPLSTTTDVVGRIMDESGRAMEKVEVEISGGMDMEVKSTAAGIFEFEDLPKGYDYQVRAAYNKDPLNGISTYDLVLMSKHILGLSLLNSPYKIIAADINRSGTISAIDLVELRKLILFIDTSFQYNTSWRFLPSDFVFTDRNDPFSSPFPEYYDIQNLDSLVSDLNFMALKTGDLNGSARPNRVIGSEPRTTRQEAVLGIADQWLEAGQNYRIAVRAEDLPDLLGLQLNLTANQEDLKIVDVEWPEQGVLPGLQAGNFGKRLLSENVLTMSWAGQKAVRATRGSLLFYLLVEAKTDAFLADLLHIGSRYTSAEAYSADLDIMDLNLAFLTDSKVQLVSEGYQLLQNRPNPFAAETIIGFYLPEPTPVRLSIYDLSGRLVEEISGDYSKGYHEWPVDAKVFESSGLYMYRLETPAFTDSRKMMLQR
ncbi:MAG: T9SS type A sorting domain-containing protein [Bacteroidota bacterium]